MVVRPYLTRVNVIIAMALLGASAQELVYLPDHFQNHSSMLAYGSKFSSFTFSWKLDMFFKLPITFPPFNSSVPLCSCFSCFSLLQFFFKLQDRCIFRKCFPCQSPSVEGGIIQAVRAWHECPASWKGLS